MTNKRMIKEIIIMLLICLIAMLVFAIVFYDYIPNRKTVAEVTNYQASDSVRTLLEDDIDTTNNTDVILSYEVTSSDLSSYQTTNEYVPGKANPFAAGGSSSSTDENGTTDNTTGGSTSTNQTTGQTTNTNTNTNTSTNTNSSGYFKDTGTK